MIKSVKKDIDFLSGEKSYEAHPFKLDIWWLGQSGYLIQWNGLRILLDPYLSDSLTKKYLGTDKPHTRMSELVIDPALLTHINFVTASHAHTDHLDPDTLAPILKNNPDAFFIIPEAHRALASSRAKCEVDRPIGLNIGQSISLGDIYITGIPAAHESLDKDSHGNALYLGYVIQFGPWSIYHSGDTILYPGMVEWLKPFDIDLCFLPINGADPKRKVSGNLNAKEAVWLAEQINTKWAIPGHYHMFEFNTVEPDEFISLADQSNLKYKVIQIGEHIMLSKE